VQPSFAFVELARQDHHAAEVHQGWRDDGISSPAVSLGECYHLQASLPGNPERFDLGRKCELRETGDLKVGPADLPSKIGAFLEMTLAVLVTQRPRLDDPQVHESYCSAVVLERDVLVGLPAYRQRKEFDLLDDAVEVPAPPRQ
jgi:hypothetical protein